MPESETANAADETDRIDGGTYELGSADVAVVSEVGDGAWTHSAETTRRRTAGPWSPLAAAR